MLLDTLSTSNLELLAVTLAIVAEVARDEYNREILTDLGVVSKLSQPSALVGLHNQDDPQLSKPFCDAVANLLDLPKNRKQFGNRRIIMALKNFLKQGNADLSKPLTKAIYDLSLIPSNCVILHDVGIGTVSGILGLVLPPPARRIYSA